MMFVLLLVGFLALGVRMIAPYLLTLLMGGILAILFHPLYHWLMHRIRRRWLASLLTVLLIFVVVLGPLITFSIIAIRQGVELFGLLAQHPPDLRLVPQRLFGLRPVRALFGNQQQLLEQLRTAVQSFGKLASALILRLAGGLPGGLLDLIIALVACYFFLIDGTRLRNWLQNKIPLDADVRQLILETFRDTSKSTIWSACAGALLQAGFLIFGFLVCGVPGVFVAGGSAFILAWIPITGSIPVWLIGIVYLLSQHQNGAAAVLLGLGILAGIGDNIVRPLALRGKGGMHGLVGLVAIFGGIDRFGIFGVFYGPILAAMVISLLEVWPTVAERFGIRFESKGTKP